MLSTSFKLKLLFRIHLLDWYANYVELMDGMTNNEASLDLFFTEFPNILISDLVSLFGE